jgi:hypothetical protein
MKRRFSPSTDILTYWYSELIFDRIWSAYWARYYDSGDKKADGSIPFPGGDPKPRPLHPGFLLPSPLCQSTSNESFCYPAWLTGIPDP